MIKVVEAQDREDFIRVSRASRPVDPVFIIARIATDRHRWETYHIGCRHTAREDIKTALQAELDHAKEHFRKIVSRRRWSGFYDYRDPNSPSPDEFFRTAREVFACNALNALVHAGFARQQVTEQIRLVRSQWEAANDGRQSRGYQDHWREKWASSRDDLRKLIRRRRRDWSRFINLLRDYQITAFGKVHPLVAIEQEEVSCGK